MDLVTNGGLLARLTEQLDALPTRSRRLLGFLVLMLSVLWVLGLWWFLYGSLNSTSDSIADRQSVLDKAHIYEKAYAQAIDRIAAAEERLSKNKGQKPSSFLESKAKEHDISDQIKSIKEQGAETVGGLVQTRFRVVIQKIPLKSATEFLYDVETSGFMSAESAKFKTVAVSGEKKVNLTLDVVAYSKSEGS